MIPAGKRLTIVVEGTTDAILPLDESDVYAGVMDILSHKFTVNSLSIMPRSSVYVGILDWPYRAQVVVTTITAYNAANDPASIVANAFYTVAGSLPTVGIEGYTPIPQTSVDPSKEPSSGWGFGLWTFGIAAIAVAIFVAKRG